MNTTCSVRLKRQGSYDILMPACNISKLFAKLSGAENLTKPVQAAMIELGYSFEVVQEARTV